MKRIVSILVVFFILMNVTGCGEAWRKKFVRKKKEVVRMPRIRQLKKYEKKPTPELYKKHYTYWMSWQSELIKVLGENHKKDSRCIEEILGNLKDMQAMLVEEKAKKLAPHIDKLTKVKEIILKEDLTFRNKDYIKRTLEKEDRAIRREFGYAQIKDYLKKSFEDEGQKSQ